MTDDQAHDEPATPGKEAAPGDLEVLRRFVNTADVESGSDEVADPEALGAWLRDHDLAGPSETFGAPEVARVIAFREALRAVLLSHHGEQVEPRAVAALGAAAADAPLLVTFAPDGAARLVPARDGVEGVLARLLAIVVRAEDEGTWSRMKACPADTCRWAFYDRSRNRSRTWCDMAVCGNRAKARTYRRRSARRGDD